MYTHVYTLAFDTPNLKDPAIQEMCKRENSASTISPVRLWPVWLINRHDCGGNFTQLNDSLQPFPVDRIAVFCLNVTLTKVFSLRQPLR